MKRSSPAPHRRPGSSRRKSLIRIATLALAPAMLGFTPAARAQSLRLIPAEARFGEFELVRYPEATIDGKAMRLAAGAQIRDARNMIALPATVSGKHPALYRLDPDGQLSRVWLLAPDEIEAAKARPTDR
jgi:hypothetical protein